MDEEERPDRPAQELQRAVDSKMGVPQTLREQRGAATDHGQRVHQRREQRRGQSLLRSHFRLPGLKRARGQPWEQQKE